MKRDGELLILDGLEGHSRADELTSTQQFLKPFAPTIELFYTGLFFTTLLVLLMRFIVVPLLKKRSIKVGEPVELGAQIP